MFETLENRRMFSADPATQKLSIPPDCVKPIPAQPPVFIDHAQAGVTTSAGATVKTGATSHTGVF